MLRWFCWRQISTRIGGASIVILATLLLFFSTEKKYLEARRSLELQGQCCKSEGGDQQPRQTDLQVALTSMCVANPG